MFPFTAREFCCKGGYFCFLICEVKNINNYIHIFPADVVRRCPLLSAEKIYKKIVICHDIFSNYFIKNPCFFFIYLLILYMLIINLQRGGADKWQSVMFAVRELLLVSRFLTRTDVPTEHGSPTLQR